MNSSLYVKLAEQICSDYAAVGRLPSERSLAQHYACTRSTIRSALSLLRDRGHLQSEARRGYRLKSSSEPASSVSSQTWNIVMLLTEKQLEDQNILDLVGGAITAASRQRVNLVVRQLDERLTLAPGTLEQLHPGIEADGYFLSSATERMRNFLENLFKPCVVLGWNQTMESIENRRFIQVYLPMEEKVKLVMAELLRLGHRRLLYVNSQFDSAHLRGLGSLLGHADLEIDCIKTKWPSASHELISESATQVLAALRNHTALVVHSGGATHYNIYHNLLKSRVDIPGRLSLLIDSGRFDWLISVGQVASVFSSAAEEGAACINELVAQLKTGSLKFGCRTAAYQFRPGLTLGPAMSREECEKYDLQTQWKKGIGLR